MKIQHLRERAGFSQRQAADHVGVSQAQMSRYEADPENVPHGTMVKLLELYGTDLLSELAVDREDGALDFGRPYARIDRKLYLLLDYAGEFDEGAVPGYGELPDSAYGVEDLRADIARLKRRPVVALTGLFDAAKSRVANALLGGRRLPEDFTPTTATLTVVRHVDGRPNAGMLEDVVLLRESFWPTDEHGELDLDPRYLDDAERIAAHRLVAGSYDVLRKYGIHLDEDGGDEAGGDGDTQAHTALVYMDAPILESCTLLDLPGFGDAPEGVSEDVKKANAAVRLADVIVYCSGVRGFMGSADLLHLGNLLRTLPQPEAEDEAFPTLGNLFILATHANPTVVRDDQLERVQNRGAKRILKHLDETVLPQRAEATEREIGVEEIAARIFPFWAESTSRTAAFEEELRRILAEAMPRVREQEIARAVEALKASAKGEYQDRLARFEKMLAEIEEVAGELAQQEAAAEEREEVFRAARHEVRAAVEAGHQRSMSGFDGAYAKLLSVDVLEGVVRGYGSKDEAKEFAPAYVSEQLQDRLESVLEPEAEKVRAVIERYLAEVGTASFGERYTMGAVDVPFDTRGAFVGGLAGVATWGALAFWASTLGNLGGYIIAAKAVSVLTALGISVGGTAGVMSFMAAIGGPITLAVGLAAVFGLGFWRLFGESWQRRLAKKIEKQFREQGVRGQFHAGIERFWGDTLSAFERGADAFEARYEEYLKELRAIVADREGSRKRLERQIEAARVMRDFFAGLPWVPLSPGGDGAQGRPAGADARR